MKLRYLYLFSLLLAITTQSAFTQSNIKQPLKLVTYKDNVIAPLTLEETALIKEVYADKFEGYVLNRPQKLKDLKNLLRNRVDIKEMRKLVDNPEKYKTLSEAGLFNSYNKSLTFDSTYNKQSFNVLKYNLEFFGKGSRIYRIDNTNYFIIIKSQHQ